MEGRREEEGCVFEVLERNILEMVGKRWELSG